MAAYHGEQFHLGQDDGCASEELHRLFFNIRLFVLDHPALNDFEFLRLGHGGTHVDEHALLIEQGGECVHVALGHPVPLLL